MRVRFRRRAAAVRARPADDPAGEAARLGLAGGACCCPARPVVTVVMASAAARRHPVDLLCGHHYGACRVALIAAGAAVYDEMGVLAAPGARGRRPARPVPAGAAPPRRR
ncbi:MAG TPA: hypothetical protein VLW50_31670 [Streptosporangiaceae bacterium]|nr:hypothetical protein [Streptosporangiaceae bacterium]